MFGRGFVEANILANAQGQPFVVGDLITHIGNFVAPDIAVWNTFFALIQLCHRRRPALPARRSSRPWPCPSPGWLGVWVFGEGLGMLLTGTATRADGRAGQRAHVRPHRPHVLAPRPAPGRDRGAGARRRSASRRPPRPRASGARSRRCWCGAATGAWRPSSSCSPTTARPPRCRARSWAWPTASPAGSAAS